MINIEAKVTNNLRDNEITLNTNGSISSLEILSKENGNGLSINGG